MRIPAADYERRNADSLGGHLSQPFPLFHLLVWWRCTNFDYVREDHRYWSLSDSWT
jgi:hypothetical protein